MAIIGKHIVGKIVTDVKTNSYSEGKVVINLSMPVKNYNNKTKENETQWHKVTLFTKDDARSKMVEKGAKVYFTVEKESVEMYNDKAYLNNTCYKYEILESASSESKDSTVPTVDAKEELPF